MKKSLEFLRIFKLCTSLFFDLAVFIYLVVTSAIYGASEAVSASMAFSLVIAWFVWVAAVVLSVLIVKGFKKRESEKELKIELAFAFVLTLIGVFVLVDVNVLMLLLFAFIFAEFMINEKYGQTAESEKRQELPEPQEKPAEESPVEEIAAAEEPPVQPVRKKVLTPKRRGDDAVPYDDRPTD